MATKHWRYMRGMNQWESRQHPDFLFVRVEGNRVVRRHGNAHFNLSPSTPIFSGDSEKDAKQFAKKYIKKYNGDFK